MLLSLAVAVLQLVSFTFAQRPPPVLIYSKTAGFRHDSIPVAISALKDIADRTSLYTPTFSEDEALFTSKGLSKFKAIVFLSTTEQVLTKSGEVAFADWLTKGGSIVGLHSATACLFNDTAFGTAMGSWFNRHPETELSLFLSFTFTKVIDHETVDMLPDRYTTFEEVYSFQTDPHGVEGWNYQGTPHPIAWLRDSGMNVDLSNGTAPPGQAQRMNGKMWMTSLGHANETWESKLHLAHVEAGLRWALADFNPSTIQMSLSPSPSSLSTSKSDSSSNFARSSLLSTLLLPGLLAATVLILS
ncbi:ThuA domain-containing protein [Sporobolomyces salmoneus]|uniref:ThuA domain-containing protein n=1 Tax=Sporobolomyces salmoneus TaxID=183962 RepID=UPI0031775F7C